MRHSFVTRIAALLCLLWFSASAQVDLQTLLKGVESHYNRAKTLEVQFNEGYTGVGGPRQSESGRLTLRKPGRMRWDYSMPPGKLFVSDGKQVFLYSPELNRVERMPLKQSEDMRAPLAFLLGKLDFAREFRDIQMKPAGADYLVTAGAKSDRLPYEKIEMVVTPGFAIRRLVVNGQDQSVLTFQFDQDKLNPPVDDARFHFKPPAGSTVVSGESAQ